MFKQPKIVCPLKLIIFRVHWKTRKRIVDTLQERTNRRLLENGWRPTTFSILDWIHEGHSSQETFTRSTHQNVRGETV